MTWTTDRVTCAYVTQQAHGLVRVDCPQTFQQECPVSAVRGRRGVGVERVVELDVPHAKRRTRALLSLQLVAEELERFVHGPQFHKLLPGIPAHPMCLAQSLLV